MQEQQVNQITQAMPTFFIPNVPSQSVTSIQPQQQILLNNSSGSGQTANFMQSVRMPISSVNQWTTAPRIMLSQAANSDHFIMHNRPELQGAPAGSIGVNQRFIPTHSFVVTHQPLAPNQMKQPFSSQIQIPICAAAASSHGLTNASGAASLSLATGASSNATTSVTGISNPTVPQMQKINLNGSQSLLSIPAVGPGQTIKIEAPRQMLVSSETSGVGLGTTVNITSHAGDRQGDNRGANANSCVNRRRVNEILHAVDPLLQLDDDVQDLLNSFMEEFLTHVTEKAFELSKLRNSNAIDMKDFQYIFERDWNVFVAGYPSGNERSRKSSELEVHKMRMALIQKHCKK